MCEKPGLARRGGESGHRILLIVRRSDLPRLPSPSFGPLQATALTTTMRGGGEHF